MALDCPVVAQSEADLLDPSRQFARGCKGQRLACAKRAVDPLLAADGGLGRLVYAGLSLADRFSRHPK